ncbi:MAG: hypothetical protein R2712_14295 [Vicinamibacterales bacterium]
MVAEDRSGAVGAQAIKVRAGAADREARAEIREALSARTDAAVIRPSVR